MNHKSNMETGGRDPLGRLMFPPVERPSRAMDLAVCGGAAVAVLALIGALLYAAIK